MAHGPLVNTKILMFSLLHEHISCANYERGLFSLASDLSLPCLLQSEYLYLLSLKIGLTFITRSRTDISGSKRKLWVGAVLNNLAISVSLRCNKLSILLLHKASVQRFAWVKPSSVKQTGDKEIIYNRQHKHMT